ncbi:hypothetical protein LINPERHAP2_LOCUS41222 [Linum perenne]
MTLFFILLPAEPNSKGWFGLLRLLRDWTHKSISLPGAVGSSKILLGCNSRSFAQVVEGKSFSISGRCTKQDFGGVLGVTVEEDGVKKRLAFLDCCLVFRFRTSDRINWDSFQVWANRHWGSALDAHFQSLGDGLWMLFCGSKARVDRIIALRRWMFGQIPLQLDSWIPNAGRSRVLLDDDIVLVTIRGIPIHLRSPDLFRQLGDICGSFLSFKDAGSLSSVRLKIKLKGSIPDEIPITFRGFSFPLKVELEAVVPISSPISADVVDRYRRAKGSCSASPTSSFTGSPFVPLNHEAVDLTSAEVAVVTSEGRCASDALSNVPKKAYDVTTHLIPSSEIGSISAASRLSARGQSCYVGLQLDSNSKLHVTSSCSTLCDKPTYSFDITFGLNKSVRPVSSSLSPPPISCFTIPNFPTIALPSKPSTDFSTPLVDSPISSFSSPTTVSSSSSNSQISQEPFEAFFSSSEEQTFSQAVQEVAEAIGLKMEGSLIKGTEAALKTCSEVLGQRQRT